jgi:hypothetical protein
MNLRDKFKDKWRWVGIFFSILVLVLAFGVFSEHVTTMGFVAWSAAWFMAALMNRLDIEANPKYWLLLLLIPPIILVPYWLTSAATLVTPHGNQLFGIFMGYGICFVIFGGKWPKRQENN